MGDLLCYRKFFVSLGCDCHPAWHMRRLGLRRQAWPLDWVLTPDIATVGRLIESGFDGFTDRDCLSLDESITEQFPYIACGVRHSGTGVVFAHDYERQDLVDGRVREDHHEAVVEKYRRRIDRLRSTLEGPGHQVIFCRRQRWWSDTHVAYDEFDRLIARLYPKLKMRMFVYMLQGEELSHVVDDGRISYYRMPLPSADIAGFRATEAWDEFYNIVNTAQVS